MGVSWVLIIFEHFMLAHWKSGMFVSLLRRGFGFMIASALSASKTNAQVLNDPWKKLKSMSFFKLSFKLSNVQILTSKHFRQYKS